MAKEYAKNFYNSKSWKETQRAYLKKMFYTCEVCGYAANTVHHIIHITPENINDINITLNFENLMAVCEDCHNKKHKSKKRERRYTFNENGDIIYIPPSEK